MRRNLLIAEALVASFPEVNVLLITGAREVAVFDFPDRVDAVSLPSLYKESNEVYAARSFQLEVAELIRMRTSIIKTSIEAFKPDVFIVDKVPRGTMGELDLTLEYLANYTSCKCVLGLRDILDDPETSTREWETAQCFEAVRSFYEEVWIYGDKTVYDQVNRYTFLQLIREQIKFTGYLDPTARLAWARQDNTSEELLKTLGARFFMCTVGGGQDGAALAHAFSLASFGPGIQGLIVTGPHMPAQARQRLERVVAQKPHLKLVNFLPEPIFFYRAAEKVVSMGGYNTTAELLGLSADGLIVPRVQPRQEQLIRSNALKAKGLMHHVHPDEISPELISQWFLEPAATVDVAGMINMRGLESIPKFIGQLIGVNAPLQEKSSSQKKYHAIT